MNNIYRVIWSEVQQAWVAVSELSKAQGKSKSAVLSQSTMKRLAGVALAMGLGAIAIPSLAATARWNGNSGDGMWTTAGNWNTVSVPTSSDYAIIDDGSTVEISSGDAAIANGLYLGYGAGNTNTLIIGDGASLTAGYTNNVLIGGNAGDTGVVSLMGAGATTSFDVIKNMYVGSSGTGSLNVDLGEVSSGLSMVIGDTVTSVGTVTLTDSTLNVGTSLTVGNNGTGTLTIAANSTVNVNSGSSDVYLGSLADSNGTLNIGAAAGETATAAGTLAAANIVIGSGTGTLVFNHTDSAYNFDLDIYDSQDHGNIYLYSGTTSLSGDMSNYNGDITVEGGTLSIDSSDNVVDGSGQIGVGAGTDGTVLVDGGAWRNFTSEGVFTVGGEGAATLNISNGGQVAVYNSGEAMIAESLGSTGSVSVDGSGSLWEIDSTLFVGGEGDATLDITNGGAVTNYGTAYISANQGTSSVLVDGSGSSWTSSSDLYVGDGGNGTLTISNGGTVTADGSTVYIGSSFGTTSTLNIGAARGETAVDPGTLVANAVQFGEGSGQLVFNHLDEGYDFTAAIISDPSRGRIYLDSGLTSLSGDMSAYNGYIYVNGGAALFINDSDAVHSSTASIGTNDNGTVYVDGSGASWSSTSSLYVGEEGNGSLHIINGGTVSSSTGYIGSYDGGHGVVEVDGSGSSWTMTYDLILGGEDGAGAGVLSITDGGVVSNGSWAYIGQESGGSGTVTVTGAGSSWNTGNKLYVGYSGTGSLTISDGANVNVDSDTGTVIINAGSESGTLSIGAAYEDGPIAAGTLNAATVKFGADAGTTGTGKLVFNHTNTDYVFAPDIVDGGSVGTYSIEMYSGSTRFTGDLSGFTGSMTNDGGTLSVASSDTLTLGGDYTQTANSVFKIGVLSDASYGKLVVAGTAAFDDDAKIDVDVAEAPSLSNGAVLSGVISAGSLEATTFALTDNSTLFDFEAAINGNQVDLNVIAFETSSGTGGVTNSVASTGFDSGLSAAKVLDTIVSGEAIINADMEEVVTALGKLETEAEVSQAVADTMPMLVAGTAPIASGTLHATSRVVQARQSSFTGASSGDGFLTDRHLWLKPVGNWAEQDQRNGVSGYKADSYGFVGGIDGDLSESTKLGFAVSYMNTDVKGKDTASGNKADIDAYQAIVYGSQVLADNIELNWQADVGFNKNEGTRNISFMNRVAKADYDSYTAHIGAGVGKSFALNDKTNVVPSIRADYAYIKDESYNETGAGALNLNVDGNTSDEFILTAQGSLSHELNDKATLIANASIGYDLINEQTSLTASYSGGGTAFTTQGIDPSPWIGSAGAGINYNISDTSEITARYDVEGRSDFLSQTASVKFRWMF